MQIACWVLNVDCLVTAAAMAQSHDSSGTGFVVNAEGWFATNAHVIEGCVRLEVPGQQSVITRHVDSTNDLAVPRVENAAAGRAITFRSNRVRLGEDIAAFGYPHSGLLSSSVKITSGNLKLAGWPCGRHTPSADLNIDQAGQFRRPRRGQDGQARGRP
jgi:hypothetical protein